MPGLSTQASRGVSLLLGQSIISGVFRIANVIILAHLLLQAEMGQIALLAVIYGFTQFLAALGLNHAAPLIVPEEEKNGQYRRIRGFLTRSLLLITIASITIMLLLSLLLPSILNTGLLSDEMLKVIIFIIPFSAMEVFLDSFLLSRFRVIKLAIGRIAFESTRILSTVILVIIGLGVVGVAYGWLAAEVIAVFFFYAAAKSDLPKQKSPIDMKPILVFAIPSLLFQTVDVTIQNTDRIILLILTNLESLGVYDVIVGFLFVMIFFSLALATSIYPILTRIRLKTGDEGDFRNEISWAVSILVRYILILLIPFSIIISMNSNLVLTSLFGSSYSTYPYANISLSLLVLAYSVWGLTYALHTVLRSIGETKFFVVVGISVILFEIVGCWYLTSLFGLLGTSLIRSMYIVLLFLFSWIRLRHKGIRWMRSTAHSFFRITMAALSVSALVLFMAPQNVIDMIVSFSIAGLLYILLLFGIKEINEFDFRMAKAVLPTFMHGFINRIQSIYENWNPY